MSRNVTQALGALVDASHSLGEILARAVRVVATELSADACSVFLVDPRDERLHLLAGWGLDEGALGKVSLDAREGIVGRVLAEMRPLAVELAAAHPAYRYLPETREERFTSLLAVPMALRGRPVGVLVVQTAERRAFTEEEVESLETIAAQLVGVVANARLIEALHRGERADRALALRGLTPLGFARLRQPRTLQGHAASEGIAVGPAALRGVATLDATRGDLASRGAEAERARLRGALERTREDILRVQRAAAHEADEEHALIFSSHLMLLHDPALLDRVEASIAAGASAAVAVDAALLELERQLESTDDPYLRERMDDIHDLRGRVLGHLLGGGAPASIRGRVVVSRRIPPSLIVEIKAEGGLGLVTEVGGTTSHGVLLARAMRVPVVTGIQDLDALLQGDAPVIVDGTGGAVVVDPSADLLAAYGKAAQDLERRRAEFARYRDVPCRTADGVRVALKANVSIAADIAMAVENGAEGVGLYRTEFPFILREDFPTREEQVRIYRRAWDAFPEGPINFRVLDLGGDKFIPGGAIATARSPFHGYRSIRVLFDHPDVLADQVQAFALAAGRRPLRVLIPMVSSVDDLRRVRKLLDDALAELPGREGAPAPLVGAMIEVPAAVEIAADLARESDFLSVGTNDLIQYGLVVDREDSRMSARGDAHHPAILRMIRRVARAARAAGRSVSVCGEMAADHGLAPLLVALGVDELSVVPAAIPAVKQALAAVDLRALAANADELLALPTAEDVRVALRGLLAAPARSAAPRAGR